jgi:hypothetical protein
MPGEERKTGNEKAEAAVRSQPCASSAILPIAALFLASTLACPAAPAQMNKTFPTDHEIGLMVSQAERARRFQ